MRTYVYIYIYVSKTSWQLALWTPKGAKIPRKYVVALAAPLTWKMNFKNLGEGASAPSAEARWRDHPSSSKFKIDSEFRKPLVETRWRAQMASSKLKVNSEFGKPLEGAAACPHWERSKFKTDACTQRLPNSKSILNLEDPNWIGTPTRSPEVFQIQNRFWIWKTRGGGLLTRPPIRIF